MAKSAESPAECRDGGEWIQLLHIGGQRSGDAVAVDFIGLESFRLEENLVRGFVGKAHDLVLNARTIPRPARLNLPGVHRGAMQIRSDQLMHARVRMRDVHRHLRQRGKRRGDGEMEETGRKGWGG